ncbi:MAG: 3-hydroxyacyl-CoA dehydrogenase [Rhodospirillaceae bacterium]|jgi:L-gulonate 3-dehydrogenase|nr:3-hydroxyacyl-CoA dehydrogenase [Rhodospirillaceae bacterium]MBT5667570.1 3-hydroxyacyl-CoA dehydrogenase [Rhodospirillaceae bacterium]
MSGHIAIVGGGLVGSGWSIVFARAGEVVRIYDADSKIRNNVLDVIQGQLKDLKSSGLVDNVDAILNRIEVCSTLQYAIGGATYVQESVFEQTDVKTEISAALSPMLGDDAVVGSSTSGIPASAFTEGLPNRDRFLVAHPVNPPYLAPIVEVVPTSWTNAAAVDKTMALMKKVGQSPVLVRREIEGFLLNRLQGALLREAWALFEDGYASIEDIDKTVSEGLGLRWSFMGPFETIDLNAPGGVKDYAERLGPLYHSIDASRQDPQPWSAELIDAVQAERRAVLHDSDLSGRRAWRDRRLMALAAHKTALKD